MVKTERKMRKLIWVGALVRVSTLYQLATTHPVSISPRLFDDPTGGFPIP
jgi:hypothetical protein